MKKIKVQGLDLFYDDLYLESVEFLEELGKLQSNESINMRPMMEELLGSEGYEKVKNHIKGERKFTPQSEFSDFLTDFMEKVAAKN